MTVLAWDGRTLAADKLSADSGLARTVTKIRRGPNGCLMGASGDHATAKALFDWWEKGGAPEAFPDKDHKADLLVVEASGRVLVFEGTASSCVFEDRFYALGHGRDFATAAMHLGQSATEAVELACQYDIYCGNGIDVLDLLVPGPGDPACVTCGRALTPHEVEFYAVTCDRCEGVAMREPDQ